MEVKRRTVSHRGEGTIERFEATIYRDRPLIGQLDSSIANAVTSWKMENLLNLRYLG
jgi:hypothetical protein